MIPTGLAGVYDGPQVRVCQHARGVAQVRLDGGHAVAGGQQRPGMGQDHGVDVDVGDPGRGEDRPGSLVDGGGGGEPGAQVDELADPWRAAQVTAWVTNVRFSRTRSRSDG